VLDLKTRDRTRAYQEYGQCEEHEVPVRIRDYQDFQHHWNADFLAFIKECRVGGVKILKTCDFIKI